MIRNPVIQQLMQSPRPWLTDGGLETSLIFHEGLDLPEFAAWPLIDSDDGRTRLRGYFTRYIRLADEAGTGFVLDTPTWRAGAAWAEALGTDADRIAEANRRSVAFARELAGENDGVTIAVNGVIGPAGDGYSPETLLTPEAARGVHQRQVDALATAGCDMVSAVTMTHAGEAIGVVLAARAAGIPVVISFTTETDGRLPDGQSLQAAIEAVEEASDGAPLYYMVNCAHPDHFRDALDGGRWLERIGGVRANASRMSHAELDAAETLDDGDPDEFGTLHAELAQRLPNLRVVGGCCGTDHRHVGCVANAVVQPQPAVA